MRHFVSRNLIECYHDYQEKIRVYKQDGIIEQDWMIEKDRDRTYYYLISDCAQPGSDDFIELVWYQLDEQYN